jgi:hypothetical protein
MIPLDHSIMSELGKSAFILTSGETNGMPVILICEIGNLQTCPNFRRRKGGDPPMAQFTKGDDPVGRDDFDAVVAVLQGESRWQRFIVENIEMAQLGPADAKELKFKDGTFKIDKGSVNPDGTNDFKVDTRSLGLDDLPSDAAGVTDKLHSKIIMKEWDGARRSYLLAVLHECVHLISDPASGGTRYSTAHSHLGGGLLEGLVEAITEDILVDQKIPLPRDPGMIGHPQRVPIVRELMAQSDSSLWGWLLFRGNPRVVNDFIKSYSLAGWTRIKNMAVLNMTERAINEIRRLSKSPFASNLRTCGKY